MSLARCPCQPYLGEGEEALPGSPRRVAAPPTTLPSLPRSSLSDASWFPAVCQQLLGDINSQPLAEATQAERGGGAGGGEKMEWGWTGSEETRGSSLGSEPLIRGAG